MSELTPGPPYKNSLRNGLWNPMKRRPKPLGNKAMTAAERQARFCATHVDETPRIGYRRPVDRRSRAQRWQEAVAELVAL